MKGKKFIPILILAIFEISPFVKAENITFIGTGYVGLISGGGLAECGNNVICADIDTKKISALNNGNIPIYEPGLESIIKKNLQKGKLHFTDNVASAIQSSNIIFIAVGTPMASDGQADLSALKSVLKTIGENLNGYKIICTKSTVPIGTHKFVKSIIQEHNHNKIPFDIVSNPEFLREGSAIQDFFEKNPIILGSDSPLALAKIQEIYQPFIEKNLPLIVTNPVTAESIKYAWNAFSALRISYVNELAHLCNAVGADIRQIVHGMSFSEQLLPTKNLKPGPGAGGSCLPKDTQALVAAAKQHNVDLSIIKTVIQSNEAQKEKIIAALYSLLSNNVTNKTIAILGLHLIV